MTDQAGLFPMDKKTAEHPLSRAAKQQIKALQDENLIRDEHAMTVELIYALAEVIGKAATKGQASAMSFACKELREAQALLPKSETIGTFDQLMNELNKDDEDARRADPLYA